MKKGIWIDHEKAVIVSLTNDEDNVKVIHSGVKKHSKAGNSADDTSLNVFTKHLKDYYEEVISHLRESESLYIIGPGEAKGELEKRLVQERLDDRIDAIETADKMTDPQIVEKVNAHFLRHSAARIMPN
jgi:stalled ribosome rescue protein Dom34